MSNLKTLVEIAHDVGLSYPRLCKLAQMYTCFPAPKGTVVRYRLKCVTYNVEEVDAWCKTYKALPRTQKRKGATAGIVKNSGIDNALATAWLRRPFSSVANYV